MEDLRLALDRRQWLKLAGLALAGTLLPAGAAASPAPAPAEIPAPRPAPDRAYVLGFEVDLPR